MGNSFACGALYKEIKSDRKLELSIAFCIITRGGKQGSQKDRPEFIQTGKAAQTAPAKQLRI